MNKKRSTTNSNSEVEQLLEAAQDELELKLAVDSHMSRVAPDYLHSDLDRRFNALKSRPSSTNPRPKQQKPSSSSSFDVKNVVVDDELKAFLGDDDDLSARFAALKASLPSSSPSDVGPTMSGSQHDGGDDEDEVQKVIQWAIDAARLDPSDEEDDCDGDDISDDDDSDDEDDLDRNKVVRGNK